VVHISGGKKQLPAGAPARTLRSAGGGEWRQRHASNGAIEDRDDFVSVADYAINDVISRRRSSTCRACAGAFHAYFDDREPVFPVESTKQVILFDLATACSTPAITADI
jgi:hypothetical protein